MKILKSFSLGANAISEFINKNNIPREDILTIVADGALAGHFTIFFYIESKPEEEKKGFWG